MYTHKAGLACNFNPPMAKELELPRQQEEGHPREEKSHSICDTPRCGHGFFLVE